MESKMSLMPAEWSVVVVGKWNPAILTPQGIAKHLFDKGDNEPIDVLVPLDSVSPFKVRIDGFLVTVNTDKLIIELADPSFDSLSNAAALAKKAVDRLPLTPLAGAGYNIKFIEDDPGPEFLALFDSDVDGSLSDMNMSILSRGFRRTVKWHDGELNIFVEQRPEGRYQIHFNITRTSRDPSVLNSWLTTPSPDIASVSQALLNTVLHILSNEVQNA